MCTFLVTSSLTAHPISACRCNPAGQPKSDFFQENLMKKIFGSFALACILAASLSLFAQDAMKQDSMKQDSSQQDSMKKDDSMKNDSMKKDDSMKNDQMKQN